MMDRDETVDYFSEGPLWAVTVTTGITNRASEDKYQP
jgi:hypothetical protein